MQEYLNRMESILTNLFVQYARHFNNPGVLLSGGIDSSVITDLVSFSFKNYTILSMGTEQSKDRFYIDEICRYLEHDYDWIEITKARITKHMDTVVNLLTKNSIKPSVMQISLGMGYYLLFERAHNLGLKYIFTGQGPDVLLGGYHKYKSTKDINDQIRQDLPLLTIDLKRDSIMAGHFGITLINPYFDKEFVDLCLAIPHEYKIRNNSEKWILRKYAETRGLPQNIINRPKKAFQYSTGLQKLILRMI
ncbi:MAG: asparagine synthase C-terminal domain-containing protein [Patescibacteria group bacterium]